MDTEILEQLNSIAINKSIPFCYGCYHEAPTGTCHQCGSDDLMRLLPGHGCEYGTEFIVEALLDDNVPSIDLEAEFEEFMRGCYPETTQVAWMTLDTISICKEMDPISWDLAQSEWIDQQISDGEIFTLNNASTHFRVPLFDLASFEWSFKNIFHSPNFVFENQKLLIAISTGADLKLRLSKSALVFESEFPVYEIWKERTKPIDSLFHFDFSTHTKLLLHKGNSQVFIRALTDDEFFVLKAISTEHSLEKSLDAIMGTLGDTSPERIRELFAFIA